MNSPLDAIVEANLHPSGLPVLTVARQLQRENQELREKLSLLRQHTDGLFLSEKWAELQNQRNQLRQQLAAQALVIEQQEEALKAYRNCLVPNNPTNEERK